MSTAALIVAGGSSLRFGGEVPKQFLTVAGRPLLAWTIQRFTDAAQIDNIVVVVSDEYLLHTSEKVIDPYGFNKVSKIVVGGDTRQESVMKGLDALPLSTGYVAIHDGARPIIRTADIDAVITLAKQSRAAIIARPITDTVKRAKDGFIMSTLDRANLYRAETPQVFQYDLILKAHKDAASSGNPPATDDAALIEAAGFTVRIVEPTGLNTKVTTREDLTLIRPFLESGANA